MINDAAPIDDVDRRLIGALRRGGRLSNSDLARVLGVARGTVQSRVARLVDTGVITGWGPDLDRRAGGFDVLAFATLTIAQGAHNRVVGSLEATPEVMEMHVVTGGGDLLVRLVARNNDHLHEVIRSIVEIDGVLRSSTQLALHTPLHRTLADVVGR